MPDRPWAINAWDQCGVCGGDLLYQPVAGYDPEKDPDGDGLVETASGKFVRAPWRTDLAQDGDPAVCADPTCRALGTWDCEPDGASAFFGDRRMEPEAHAAILAYLQSRAGRHADVVRRRGARGPAKLDPFLDRLGTVPDAVIAAEAGVTPSTVQKFRRRRGIPAFQESP